MKFATQHSGLLLLLLPALASALAADASPSEAKVNSVNTRHEVPTKDAPVDGKDGKPHLGPFVEADKKRTNDVQDLPPLKGRPDDWKKHDGQEIPQSNDGVMFDKNRERPAKGKTGTEGGVSEKEKSRKAREDKIGGKLQQQPESPKAQPPLPHSEEQKLKSKAPSKKESKSASSDKAADSNYSGLDKPDDLPDTPHQKTQTKAKGDTDPSSKQSSTPKTNTKVPSHGKEEEGIIQPFHSFVLSLTMILFSEVGDKTFLVAALMAMKHDRMVVFSAAFSALLVMTVLSAVLGHTVPTLLPKRVTNLAASVLFFVFGAKLLHEGLQMDPNEGVGAEMSEVEQELAAKEKELGRDGKATDNYSLEMGMGGRRPRSRSQMAAYPRSPSQSPVRPSSAGGALAGFMQGMGNLLSLLLSPAWVQTFVMTFLGEWGDRSQIATIAMAAGQDYWWVTLGAVCGHAVCTGAAVIGGRAIAGRVSLKVVTVGGAVAFLVFGLIYLIDSFYA